MIDGMDIPQDRLEMHHDSHQHAEWTTFPFPITLNPKKGDSSWPLISKSDDAIRAAAESINNRAVYNHNEGLCKCGKHSEWKAFILVSSNPPFLRQFTGCAGNMTIKSDKHHKNACAAHFGASLVVEPDNTVMFCDSSSGYVWKPKAMVCGLQDADAQLAVNMIVAAAAAAPPPPPPPGNQLLTPSADMPYLAANDQFLTNAAAMAAAAAVVAGTVLMPGHQGGTAGLDDTGAGPWLTGGTHAGPAVQMRLGAAEGAGVRHYAQGSRQQSINASQINISARLGLGPSDGQELPLTTAPAAAAAASTAVVEPVARELRLRPASEALSAEEHGSSKRAKAGGGELTPEQGAHVAHDRAAKDKVLEHLLSFFRWLMGPVTPGGRELEDMGLSHESFLSIYRNRVVARTESLSSSADEAKLAEATPYWRALKLWRASVGGILFKEELVLFVSHISYLTQAFSHFTSLPNPQPGKAREPKDNDQDLERMRGLSHMAGQQLYKHAGAAFSIWMKRGDQGLDELYPLPAPAHDVGASATGRNTAVTQPLGSIGGKAMVVVPGPAPVKGMEGGEYTVPSRDFLMRFPTLLSGTDHKPNKCYLRMWVALWHWRYLKHQLMSTVPGLLGHLRQGLFSALVMLTVDPYKMAWEVQYDSGPSAITPREFLHMRHKYYAHAAHVMRGPLTIYDDPDACILALYDVLQAQLAERRRQGGLAQDELFKAALDVVRQMQETYIAAHKARAQLTVGGTLQQVS